MDGSSKPDATFVTVADRRYFLGAVALVNSLRLTGHEGPILVLDAGLDAVQREALSSACAVHGLPEALEGHANFFKPAVTLLGVGGVVVFVDSDIIVTGNLESVLANAARGRICAFIDEPVRDRRFEEWATILPLEKELRSQPYLNSGFVALDITAWSALVAHWLEYAKQVCSDRLPVPFDERDPFGFMDQDVLNALLMAEVPPEALEMLPLERAPAPHFNRTTKVEDRETLRCRNGAEETLLLHYWDHPKPWLPGAQWTLSFDAYVDLMARVLGGPDAAVHVPPHEVPFWLREGARGKAARAIPHRVKSTTDGAVARGRRVAWSVLHSLGLR